MSGGAGEGWNTFVFADLAGFTALTEAHGDAYAADLALEFCRGIAQLLGDDAEDLKMLGDACLLRVGAAAQAVALGVSITSDLAARHGFPDVRVGMNTGPSVQRGGEWFGAAINIAARVAALAGPDQVLVTAATHSEAGAAPGIAFTDLAEHTLRHVAAPVRLYRVHRVHRPTPDGQRTRWVVDPVCRMRLDPALAAISEREDGGEDVEGVTVHFCSASCAASYRGAPRLYRLPRSPRA